MLRSRETLRNVQDEVMAECRERRTTVESVAVLPRPGGAVVMSLYGQVSQVVSSDPDNGPHLVVSPQKWTGKPASKSSSAATALICYPTPNHTLSEYQVGEYVRIEAAHGAMIAEKLA